MLSGMIHAGFEGSDYWRKNSYDPLTGITFIYHMQRKHWIVK